MNNGVNTILKSFTDKTAVLFPCDSTHPSFSLLLLLLIFPSYDTTDLVIRNERRGQVEDEGSQHGESGNGK